MYSWTKIRRALIGDPQIFMGYTQIFSEVSNENMSLQWKSGVSFFKIWGSPMKIWGLQWKSWSHHRKSGVSSEKIEVSN